MSTYQIRIDNELYESSPKESEARHLYATLDRTCLQHYNGHTKSLLVIDEDKETVLCKATIKKFRLHL